MTDFEQLVNPDDSVDVSLTKQELAVLVGGLKALHYKLQTAENRNRTTGWSPAPGRFNANLTKLATLGRLLERLENLS